MAWFRNEPLKNRGVEPARNVRAQIICRDENGGEIGNGVPAACWLDSPLDMVDFGVGETRGVLLGIYVTKRLEIPWRLRHHRDGDSMMIAVYSLRLGDNSFGPPGAWMRFAERETLMFNRGADTSTLFQSALALSGALSFGVALLSIGAVRPAMAQTYQVLYTFTGGDDGAAPYAGVIPDEAGNLYGTSSSGGKWGQGVVFELTQAGTETVRHTFTGLLDGGTPYAGLLRDQFGNLCGAAYSGGADKVGNVFRLGPKGEETVLHSFTGGADGQNPWSGLVEDAGGNLYGTTLYAGGNAFKILSNGEFEVLYGFFSADVCLPYGTLILDSAGDLYGTGEQCGAGDTGGVFELNRVGQETTLYNFPSSYTEGANPYAGLLRYDGYLYGTAYAGGKYGEGVVFRIDTAGNYTLIYSFTGDSGSDPVASVIADGAGNLYGTTSAGGAYHFGTVFEISPSGVETVLHKFTGGTDGGGPFSDLLLYQGSLYGTTVEGGLAGGCSGGVGCGVVFKLTA